MTARLNVTTHEHKAILVFTSMPHLDAQALKAGFESIVGASTYAKMQAARHVETAVHDVPFIPYVGNGKSIKRFEENRDKSLMLKA